MASHPRLLLTASVLTDLAAKKLAATTEYTNVKNYVDGVSATVQEVALSASLGTGGVGTTFTVTGDLTGWPTISHQVRIGVELLTVTRSGSTFTVVSRGDINPASYVSATTTNASHASGAEVWRWSYDGNWPSVVGNIAILVAMGDTSYTQRARYWLGMSILALDCDPSGTDTFQFLMWGAVVAYDWLYNSLSTTERAAYANTLATLAEYRWANPYGGRAQVDQYHKEMAFANNHRNSETRGILAIAAATYGEYAGAQTLWDNARAYWDDIGKDATLGGALHDAIFLEGSDYGQNDLSFVGSIPFIIDSALGQSSDVTALEPYFERQILSLIHRTLNSGFGAQTTVTTGTSGTTSATVAAASTFQAGDHLIDANTGFETTITAISGGTNWTIRDPWPATADGHTVNNKAKLLTYGDTTVQNFNDGGFAAVHPIQIPMELAIGAVNGTNATLAQYGKWWINNRAPALTSENKDNYWHMLIAKTSVTATDYSSALQKTFTTSDADGFGMAIGRTSWTSPISTIAYFIAGHGRFDHAQAYYGDYGLWRKGVWLTRSLQGYVSGSLTGSLPYTDYPTTGGVNELPYYGTPFKNSAWMLGHGAATPFSNSNEDGRTPASMTRWGATTTYVYGRADLSGMYNSAAANWVSMGYASADAQTWIRDWIWISPDLVVFHDRFVYANASTSPTTWFSIHAGNPTTTGTTLKTSASTYAGQSMSESWVLPASVSLTETDMAASENSGLRGYRLAGVSGVSASTEYGLRTIELGDSGFTPATVTKLTSGNCNAAQVGDLVFVFPTGASPTLNLTWTKVGTVTTTYVFGLTASTNYHAAYATNDGTVSTATGSGDTTATSAGLVIF